MKQNGTRPTRPGSRRQRESEERFSISHVFEAFTSLPRVLRLVWSTDGWLTSSLALLSLVRGFIPAVSVTITALVIDSVVNAIRTHVATMVWVFVGLQLAVSLLDRLLSTLSNIAQ